MRLWFFPGRPELADWTTWLVDGKPRPSEIGCATKCKTQNNKAWFPCFLTTSVLSPRKIYHYSKSVFFQQKLSLRQSVWKLWGSEWGDIPELWNRIADSIYKPPDLEQIPPKVPTKRKETDKRCAPAPGVYRGWKYGKLKIVSLDRGQGDSLYSSSWSSMNFETAK